MDDEAQRMILDAHSNELDAHRERMDRMAQSLAQYVEDVDRLVLNLAVLAGRVTAEEADTALAQPAQERSPLVRRLLQSGK